MTTLQIILAIMGALIVLLAGVGLIYTVWALLHGRRTVSGYMASAPRMVVFTVGLVTGFVIGGLAGHWFWPTVGN